MLRALFRDKIPDIDGLNPMRREPCGQEKAAAEDHRRHDEHSGHIVRSEIRQTDDSQDIGNHFSRPEHACCTACRRTERGSCL